MVNAWNKFCLLFWKNWLLQSRNRVQTLVELLIPVVFSAIVVVVRSLVDVEPINNATVYEPFSPEFIPPLNIPFPPGSLMTMDSGTEQLCDLVLGLNNGASARDPWTLDFRDLNNYTSFFGNPSARPHANNNWSSWFLVYSPQNDVVDEIMSNVTSKYGMIGCPLKDSLQLNEVLKSPLMTVSALVLGGVAFPDSLQTATEFPHQVDVKLRFPGVPRVFYDIPCDPQDEDEDAESAPRTWFTEMNFPVYQSPGPRSKNSNCTGPPGYFSQGFLGLQSAIFDAILQREKNKIGGLWPEFDVKLNRFPFPAYIADPLLEAMTTLVPSFIMLSFVYTTINSVRVVTSEKENQLKEAMKIMGLPNWLHWSAWFVKTFLIYFIAISLVLITLVVPFAQTSVLQHSDWSCLLAFFFTFTVASVTICFAISVFFQKANTAAVVSGLIWFLSYFPFVFMERRYASMDLSAILSSTLLSNTAMGYGMQIVLMYEGTGEGLQWSNLWTPVTQDYHLTMGHVMGFLLIDAFLYMCITLYVEGIYPGEYGVPLPWYFPFTKWYWMGTRGELDEGEEDDKSRAGSGDLFEREPRHLPAGVRIKNLTKVYGQKTAVDRLNLNMYEGQITVLLGHNGAGKTTTMSMLTGLYTPTSGNALIGGHSIRSEINRIRETLGLCPQHNVLFTELTVTEHLKFFGKLKGLNDEELKEEVKRFLQLLQLEDKANARVKTLSGGMQRKLAAAVALCGHSRVVLFDEPTSGMDPSARRALWDLLRAEKEGRTILLTTHFMDEADLLGDRIAIMSEGKLRCCGSSFFLKKKYGGGYYLVIVKGTDCDTAKVTTFLQRFIPDLKKVSDIGSELSYNLEVKYSAQFEQIFEELDGKKEELAVESFGVSLPSMEEVFMKAGSESETKAADDDDLEEIALNMLNNAHNGRSVAVDMNFSPLLTGTKLVWNQMIALFGKYITASLRAWILYLIIIIIPVISLSVAIFVARSIKISDIPTVRNMSLLNYPNGLVTVGHNPESPEVAKLAGAFNKLVAMDTGVVEDLNLQVSDPAQIDMTKYLLNVSTTNIAGYLVNNMLGTVFHQADADHIEVTGWFNNQPLHVPPLALSYIYNAILRHYVDEDYLVTFYNEPQDYTPETRRLLEQTGGTVGFQLGFNLGFSFAFVMAYYVVFYIKERESRAKLLQCVSGVNIFMFWLIGYVWNFVQALIPLVAIIITLVAFNEESYRTFEELGRCFFVMLSCVLPSLPLMYLLSFLFSVPAVGFSRVVLVNVLMGVTGFMVVFVLQTPSLDLMNEADILDWVLTFLPSYSITNAFYNLNRAYGLQKACKPILENYCSLPGAESICCQDEAHCPASGCVYWTEDYFDWKPPGVGRNIIFFFVETPVFLTLLFLLELRVWELICRRKVPRDMVEDPDLDSDVLKENKKIANLAVVDRPNYNLLVHGLSKYYGKFLAVNNLNVAVREGECFGLLGVNGAGKTTTFKMMTGDERISQGDAYVRGLSLKYDRTKVNQLTGYCPQFDALLEDLTGRETMRLFCLLRGVRSEEVKSVSEKLAKELLFFKHIDKQVKAYSGGTKRKLSTAIALIGDPPVVYLDEPTTGMDPVAKRHLWNVISKVRSMGKTIILTSHSMEECEALCTRLAIMVNGQFKCLGSSQHLKNKFAQGYTLMVKARKPEDQGNARRSSNMLKRQISRQESTVEVDVQPIKTYIQRNFPGAELKEEFLELLTYHIPQGNLSWGQMFGLMEAAKKQLNIEDYSLGQTTLEQVFLSFAIHQSNRNKEE